MSKAEVVQVYGEANVESGGVICVEQVFAELLVGTDSAATIAQKYAELVDSVADLPSTAPCGVVVCIVLE